MLIRDYVCVVYTLLSKSRLKLVFGVLGISKKFPFKILFKIPLYFTNAAKEFVISNSRTHS